MPFPKLLDAFAAEKSIGKKRFYNNNIQSVVLLAHAKGFCRAVALNSFVVSPIYFILYYGTYMTRAADTHLRSHIIRLYKLIPNFSSTI